MPKITAATVVEHRAAQVRALLDAARDVVGEQGGNFTLAEVATRAGLARSSVYQYFASREELVEAVVQDVFPRWSARIVEVVEGAATPREAVLGYAAENLRLVAAGEHAIASALRAMAPGPEVARRSAEMHRAMLEPLTRTLAQMGVAEPLGAAELVNAVVLAASRQVESGDAVEAVMARITSVLALAAEPLR